MREIVCVLREDSVTKVKVLVHENNVTRENNHAFSVHRVLDHENNLMHC